MRQVALVLLALTLLVPAAAAVDAQSAGTAQSATATPDGLSVTVHVQADGDAKWNVSLRYQLADGNETDAFASLLSDYRNGRDVGPSVGVFRSVAETQSDRTGRRMSIQGVSRDGSLTRGENATGRLSLSFTWTNFSVVSGTEIRVDDVFAGGWFGDLRDDEHLLIYPPGGYSLDSATKVTRIVGGGALWEGPKAFDDGPSVTFTRGTTSTGPPGEGGVPWSLVLGAAAVALLAGGVAVFLWNNRDLPPAGADASESDGGDGGASGGGGDGSDGGVTQGGEAGGDTGDAGADTAADAEGDAAAAGAAGAAGASGAAGAAAADDEDEDDEPEELLSDEERVERLLTENGGRMKQRKIVEETRWSNAKVSQLLSGMAEEGRVEKLRIGRENLISLPDENGD